MELKSNSFVDVRFTDYLLIVPYGIEIDLSLCVLDLSRLLIVPYGIEIFVELLGKLEAKLLIVPYGIEIRNLRQRK